MVSQVNGSNQQANALSNAKQQQVDLKKDNANTQAAQSQSPKAASDSVSITPQAQQLKTLHVFNCCACGVMLTESLAAFGDCKIKRNNRRVLIVIK